MFEVLGFTKESAYERFGFLLNAFKYGVPTEALLVIEPLYCTLVHVYFLQK